MTGNAEQDARAHSCVRLSHDFSGHIASSIGSLGREQRALNTRRGHGEARLRIPDNQLCESCRDGSRFGQISVSPSLHERGIYPPRHAASSFRGHLADTLDTSREPQRKPASNRAVRLLHARCGVLGGQLFKLRTQDSRQKGCRENKRASRKSTGSQEEIDAAQISR